MEVQVRQSAGKPSSRGHGSVRILRLLLTTCAFMSSSAFAVDYIPGYSTKDSENHGDKFAFYLDGSIEARVRGYEHPATASISKSHALALQARFGIRLWRTILLGIAPEYQYLNQFDDTGAFVGNWSGTQLTYLKPTFGIQFNSLKFVLAYGMKEQINLSSKTSTGQTLSYSSGTSYQAEIDFKCSDVDNVTLHYSYGSYKNQILDGVETTLASPVKWSAFGIGYTRSIF